MAFAERGCLVTGETNVSIWNDCLDVKHWKGLFFEHRGRPILVLGEKELEERLRYNLANSTKEHLVARPECWPTWVTWVDRTKLSTMKPVGRKVRPPSESDATTLYPVTLEKLPCRRDLSNAQYQEWIRRLCRQISEEAAEEHKHSG